MTALPITQKTPGSGAAVQLNVSAPGGYISLTVQNVGAVDVYVDHVNPPTSTSAVLKGNLSPPAVLVDYSSANLYAIAASGTADLRVAEVVYTQPTSTV